MFDSRSTDLGIPAMLLAAVLVLPACGADDGEPEDYSPQQEQPPALSDAEQAALDEALAGASGKADGFGLLFYEASYVNMGLAAQSPFGDIALIAGSHDKDFPYWRTQPWDNGLLYLEWQGRGYTFTHRTQGIALQLPVSTSGEITSTRVIYQGTMVRDDDGQEISVSIDIPVTIARFPAYQEGKRYNFLDCEKIPGMRWQPFSLTGDSGTIAVADEEPVSVHGIRGELEYGVLANLRAEEFGIAYDYVNVVRPGHDGYAFVDFVSHPLFNEGILGSVLDWYMVKYASETVTVLDQYLYEYNRYDVVRPQQWDASVVLFENSVDLGPANLRRQMIKTKDASGAWLYGLREIFEPQ